MVASRQVLPDSARLITVWSSDRSMISLWMASCTSASRAAMNRVPTQTPAAPSASAEATPAPVAIPPPATTGMSTARRTAGTSADSSVLVPLLYDQ